jgi:hypothetical protein
VGVAGVAVSDGVIPISVSAAGSADSFAAASVSALFSVACSLEEQEIISTNKLLYIANINQPETLRFIIYWFKNTSIAELTSKMKCISQFARILEK